MLSPIEVQYLSLGRDVLPSFTVCDVSPRPARCDSFYAYRKYSICSGSGSFHDPSQRPGHHDHPHLPTLALLQTHRGACRRGAQGIYTDAVVWCALTSEVQELAKAGACDVKTCFVSGYVISLSHVCLASQPVYPM